MLGEVASALTAPSLEEETPFVAEFEDGSDLFYLYLTVMPHERGNRRQRFRVFQDWQDDGVPIRHLLQCSNESE